MSLQTCGEGGLQCLIIGIIQYTAFSYWLLSLSNLHLSSFMSFHDLIIHFFLELNNILLSECTPVYSFTY